MSDYEDPNTQKPNAQKRDTTSDSELLAGTKVLPENELPNETNFSNKTKLSNETKLSAENEVPFNNELPPYRQSDAVTKKTASKYPLWLIPVMVVMLALGVLLGKYWGDNKATEDTVANMDSAGQKQASSGNDDTKSLTGTEQTVLSVETISPSQDSLGNNLSADGTIAAKDTASVSAKVNGVAIERILVEEGSQVKAGQVLAVFDTDALRQQVLQAQADVAEADAALVNAKSEAARVLPLLDIDAISKQEADRYRSTKIRAEATLEAAKARLNTQQLNLSNANVVAPVSGIISEKMVEVGMVAGNEPLFTIIKDGVLEWQATLDPKLVGEVKVGTPVKVTLPKDQSVMGEVSRIAPTADKNRQITIYAILTKNPAVRAGMYQKGEFQLGSASMQTVPSSAIVSNDGYDYVMLVTDMKTENENTETAKVIGRIQQLRVTLGERIGDKVAIAEPIPTDSQLVKQGGSFLNDGDLVRVVDNKDSQENKANNDKLSRS